MYSVIIVDDEPVSATYVGEIIDKKCSDFQIVGSATNGEEALLKIENTKPDIVISDIRMPIMDGLELAEIVRERFSNIKFIIISGYQDFSYAKQAIKYGVSDYLLKPLNPAKLVECLETIIKNISKNQYFKRNEMIRKICSSSKNVDEIDTEKYLKKGKYFCGIVRKNGSPMIFTSNNRLEIFSLEEEQFYTYGRDEMENLYIVPEELLNGKKFYDFIYAKHKIGQIGENYVTTVYSNEPLELKDISDTIRSIYKKMHKNITIGKNRIITLDEKIENTNNYDREAELTDLVEYLIKNKKYSKLKREIICLFDFWLEFNYTQFNIERQLGYIFRLFSNNIENKEIFNDYQFELSELFYNASTLTEILENVLEKLDLIEPTTDIIDKSSNNEQLYYVILSYLEKNINEDLSLKSVCIHFGVSQTTLSRWFRDYGNTTYNRYLTNTRINRAKNLILHNPDMYIKDISKMVGYSDQFYFSRIFRTIEGVSPSEFINLNS